MSAKFGDIKIVSYRPKLGSGCPARESGLGEHNPRPSTERGKRRHAARNEEEKKVAEKAWTRERTKQKSRYQKAMATSSGYHGS